MENTVLDKLNIKDADFVTAYKPVAIWLYIGVFMLFIQILLGGITRLTDSGLSITEWKPISGVIPPLNETQWQDEFDNYKQTTQFQTMHIDFTLHDFKKIFFWEWFHRVWGRLMGVVFLVGFVWFIVKKKFSKGMIPPLIGLFLLGAVQGAVGWIMVKSGLVPERIFVGHIELATHFMAALILIVYTMWFALTLSVRKKSLVYNNGLKNISILWVVLLFFQLIYGAFMAGLHAGIVAPTWPSINGKFAPAEMNTLTPLWHNWIDNKLAIQFIHRGLAYLILAVTIVFYLLSLKAKGSELFRKIRWLPLLLIVCQVILGILTVINSPDKGKLIYWGTFHQAVGILFLLSVILILFTVRHKQKIMTTRTS